MIVGKWVEIDKNNIKKPFVVNVINHSQWAKTQEQMERLCKTTWEVEPRLI